MIFFNKSSLSSIKNLFIFALFLNINFLYSQENTALIFFKTRIVRREKELGSSSDYIQKFNNSSFRIESRISSNPALIPETKILVGMYSVYDNCTNEPLGYLNYDIDIYNNCYIEELHINPKYRNKKIGQLLFNFALENFKENKIKTLKLIPMPFNESPMSNNDLIKYYEKFGFKTSSVFMTLQLNNNITSKL